MADENKTDRVPDNLENLSPEELQERIQQEKRNAKRSLRLAFTALIAIIAVCIAWFVNNTQVRVNGIQISAESTVSFELASMGLRQNVEENKLKDDNNQNILFEGTSDRQYSNCIDIYTGKKEELQKDQTGNNPEFHVGTNGLALYLNEQESLMPGSNGKLEFYLIPRKSGLTSATIKLDLTGYTEDSNSKALVLKNNKIQNLLKGHILFFQHLDDKYGYYGWLGEEMSVKISAPNQTFTKNIPYKVTLYWKWPQYFRNYVYTYRETFGDLFTEEMRKDQERKKEYDSLMKFVNAQKSVKSETSKLFYDAENKASDIEDNISMEMQDTVLDSCSNYYNQADEYIGNNTKYIYMQINVE